MKNIIEHAIYGKKVPLMILCQELPFDKNFEIYINNAINSLKNNVDEQETFRDFDFHKIPVDKAQIISKCFLKYLLKPNSKIISWLITSKDKQIFKSLWLPILKHQKKHNLLDIITKPTSDNIAENLLFLLSEDTKTLKEMIVLEPLLLSYIYNENIPEEIIQVFVKNFLKDSFLDKKEPSPNGAIQKMFSSYLKLYNIINMITKYYYELDIKNDDKEKIKLFAKETIEFMREKRGLGKILPKEFSENTVDFIIETSDKIWFTVNKEQLTQKQANLASIREEMTACEEHEKKGEIYQLIKKYALNEKLSEKVVSIAKNNWKNNMLSFIDIENIPNKKDDNQDYDNVRRISLENFLNSVPQKEQAKYLHDIASRTFFEYKNKTVFCVENKIYGSGKNTMIVGINELKAKAEKLKQQTAVVMKI